MAGGPGHPRRRPASPEPATRGPSTDGPTGSTAARQRSIPRDRRLPTGADQSTASALARPARARAAGRSARPVRPGRPRMARPHHPGGCTASAPGTPPGAHELPGTDEPAGRWLAGSPEVRARSRGRVIDPTREPARPDAGQRPAAPVPTPWGGRRDGHQRSLVDRWRRFDPAGPGWPASTKDRPVPGPSYVGIPRGLSESSRFDRSTAGGVRMVRSVSLEPAS